MSIPNRNPISASYLGEPAGWLSLRSLRDGAAVDGNSISPWEGNGSPDKLFPGESLSGGRIVAVPDNEFNAKDLVLTHTLLPPGESDALFRHRGAAGDPSPPYQPSRAEPGTYSFGEPVNQKGLEFTVTEYTLADTIERIRGQTRGTVEEPPADSLQFIITTFEAENVSPVVGDLPRTIELYYAESRIEAPGEGITIFEAAGEEFTGLYSSSFIRGNRKTDGNQVYPGVTVTGALASVVPRQFDASNVEVRMEGRKKRRRYYLHSLRGNNADDSARLCGH